MLPNRLWNEVAEFTRSAVTDCMPSSRHAAGLLLTVVSRLALWSTEVACVPLERDVIFAGQFIDTFIRRGLGEASPKTKHNYRLRLLQVAAELNTFEPARRAAGKKPVVGAQAPYSSREIVSFRSVGNTRTTERQRHNWMVLLTFGAGCGLSSTEIVLLEMKDVAVDDDAIRVTVRGRHPRTVICLAEWEEDVRVRLASPLLNGHLFLTDQRRDDPTLVAKFLYDSTRDHNHFAVDRLRSTWVHGHLQAGIGALLPQLMEAFGTRTARSFEKFFPLLNPPEPAAAVSFFRRDDNR